MDSMLLWMLVFAGATIGLLAVFLIASERELKIKRRELENLTNKPADSKDSNPAQETGFGQPPDVHTIRQLKADNKQLHDDIETLNTKLEVSENRVQELDAKVHGFTNLLTENDQLSKRNEELLDEITALKNQLQGAQAREDIEQGQHKALEDRCTALESELTGVKTELLNESQSSVQELQSTKARLEAAESREQETREHCADLEKQAAQLAEQLAANEGRLMRHESLETQLREVEEQYQQAKSESERFREEISHWQERFAARRDTMEHLTMLRQRLDELNMDQAELAVKQGHIRDEILSLTQLLDDAQQSRSDAAAPIRLSESTFPQTSLPSVSQGERPSLEAAKKHLEKGSHEDALRQFEQLLEVAPENREIKLYQLLASVRLYNVEGYEHQIDSIAEMTDLTDSERPIARDIFLLRAEDAQKRGRDDEMLRYRAWAKNVIYRTPFGTPEQDPPSHLDEPRKEGKLPPEEGVSETSKYTDLSNVGASDTSNGTDPAGSANGRNRTLIATSVIGILAFLGVVFSGFFEQPHRTAVPPSSAAAKSKMGPLDESIEDNALSSTNPSAAKDEAPPVHTAPQNNTSKSRLSPNGKANGTNNADAKPLASNKSQANTSAVKRIQEKTNRQDQTPMSQAASLGGAYEVVQPTQVLSEPRTGSKLIANIERGTRVNVVAARDGWFEIRSKYGRPPGFIPREAAARIQ